LFILFLFLPGLSFASAVLDVSSVEDGNPLVGYVEELPDTSGSLVLREVMAPERLGEFQPVTGAVPITRLDTRAYWYKLEMQNPTAKNLERNLIITRPWIDKTRFFLLDQKGILVQERESGEGNNGYELYPTFRFQVPAHQKMYLMLRVEDETAVPVPMQIQTNESMVKTNNWELWLIGVYYGIILLMLLYNLALFFKLQDKSYLWYILYLLFFCTFQLFFNGIPQNVIFPEMDVWLSNRLLFATIPLFLETTIFSL
jgi:hypothetical protein